jgi:transposase
MKIASVWAQRRSLRVEAVVITNASIAVLVRAISRRSRCPQCHGAMRRVHSRSQRRVAEVPLPGQPVYLHLQVRRFFCDRAVCPQRIFREPLETMAAPYARRTYKLTTALEVLGVAIGGKPGARVACQLGMPTSPDTLLRQLRRNPLPAPPSLRVVGIDDWAFKKGRRYGTIVVDLERQCPIDLLPDREATTVAQWLHAHPGVQLISRERAGAYADGARQGAPEAVQVADGWHLLKNLIDAFERFLNRHHGLLRRAAQAVTAHRSAAAVPPATAEPLSPKPLAVQAAASRTRRLARYREMRELVQQDLSHRVIARHLRLHRNTVRRFATAEEFPERGVRPPRPSCLTPFVAAVPQRWTAGCHNAAAL